MQRLGVGVGIAGGALSTYIGYDYATCHPMRKLKYNVGGAFVRLHNTLLGGGTRSWSLTELTQFDGKGGRPTYFSAKGTVYDASSSETFKSAYGMWAGRDATVCLATMSLSPNDVGRTDWDTALSQKDLETLDDWIRYFDEKYLIKGSLREFHKQTN